MEQNLNEHLSAVFTRCMQEPKEAFEKFEEHSALIKHTKLNFKDPKNESDK